MNIKRLVDIDSHTSWIPWAIGGAFSLAYLLLWALAIVGVLG